mmetsp:Transcript_8342/g.11475  ORF Transcript_8342/g.11475 Transcript_8342/m.11475 type:complete len:354 (-) Transcript_8342:39-1100(-)|eukprot:CAMPEP_0185731454 /NCGR_PEP_ID=MMETSP1171-20130828/12957_1 /TAXON_ID=374046 /ORGANISM="Helicotheca tamensis, Strain CCMP826" /LENGTH=353 /DNA_ID=CAMNT_0028400725 /DNA_START=122 /DNA_END=1186 /DNA_ORIENTATION=+
MILTQDFIFQQIFPVLGVVTASFMSFAPYRAVLKASRDGNLGDLNPTPWVFMLGNAIGWIAYSFLIQNVYVFLPNAPGIILAIWLNIQAIKLQYENYRSKEMQDAIIAALENQSKRTFPKDEVEEIVEHVILEETLPPELIKPIATAPVPDEANTLVSASPRINKYMPASPVTGSTDEESLDNEDGVTTVFQEATDKIVDYASFIWDVTAQKTPAPASHEIMVITISGVWLMLITIVSLGRSIMDDNTRVTLIGVCVNCNLVFFYGAPLSKIATVIETKSSRLIHIPTMTASLLNGSLWLFYGLALGDVYVSIPNGFGALLGVIQLLLCLVYPRHGHVEPTYLSIPGESTPLI